MYLATIKRRRPKERHLVAANNHVVVLEGPWKTDLEALLKGGAIVGHAVPFEREDGESCAMAEHLAPSSLKASDELSVVPIEFEGSNSLWNRACRVLVVGNPNSPPEHKQAAEMHGATLPIAKSLLKRGFDLSIIGFEGFPRASPRACI